MKKPTLIGRLYFFAFFQIIFNKSVDNIYRMVYNIIVRR